MIVRVNFYFASGDLQDHGYVNFNDPAAVRMFAYKCQETYKAGGSTFCYAVGAIAGKPLPENLCRHDFRGKPCPQEPWPE